MYLQWVLIQLDREYVRVRHLLFMKEVDDIKNRHQSYSQGLDGHLRSKHLGVVLFAALLSGVQHFQEFSDYLLTKNSYELIL